MRSYRPLLWFSKVIVDPEAMEIVCVCVGGGEEDKQANSKPGGREEAGRKFGERDLFSRPILWSWKMTLSVSPMPGRGLRSPGKWYKQKSYIPRPSSTLRGDLHSVGSGVWGLYSFVWAPARDQMLPAAVNACDTGFTVWHFNLTDCLVTSKFPSPLNHLILRSPLWKT